MIPQAARGAWREVEASLRSYVERRVPSRADVDDIVQETFVRIHRGLASLSDDDRFGPWVYRIAANAIADHLRAQVRQPLAQATRSEDEATAPEPDDDIEADLAECVALFVTRLPSPYREAITLTELEGRVQRGRERIRRMFDECCEISLDCRGHVTECTPRNLAEVPQDCRAAACSWAVRHLTG